MAKKEKKAKKTAKELEYEKRQESFQEHLPIADIKNRLLVTKEGLYYPVFKMGEKTLDLMSEEELNRFANQVMQSFASMNLDGVQFLTVPVPFDIGPYKNNQQLQIKNLEKKMDRLQNEIVKLEREIDNLYAQKNGEVPATTPYMDLGRQDYDEKIAYIKNVLIPNVEEKVSQCQTFIQYISDQTRFIVNELTRGNVAHKVCLVIPTIHDNWNPTAVEEASQNINSKLQSIAPDSHRCSETEIRNILFSILSPLRTEAHNIPVALPPMM